METKRNETGKYRLNRALLTALLLLWPVLMSGCANQQAADTHLDAGIAFLESRQYGAAMKELLEAEKLHPTHPPVHYYLGIIYHARGLKQEAIQEFQRAISLKPDYSDAYNYLGLIYDNAGQYDEAIKNFKKAVANISYETPSYAWNNLGWCYYKKGDYDSAAAAFTEAVKLDLNNANRAAFENNIGRSLSAKGDADGAIVHFKRALLFSSDYAEPRYWLGKMYQAQDKKKAALEEYQAFLKYAQANTDLVEKAKKEVILLTGEIKKEIEIKPIPAQKKEVEQAPAPVKKKKNKKTKQKDDY